MTHEMSPTPAQIAAWRSGAGADSPAGPLFSSQYSAAEIVNSGRGDTHFPSVCTGSNTFDCC